MKIRIANALTKPVITERETYCISRWRRSKPAISWITPISTVAAKRYSTPYSRTSGTTMTATAAVAAEIIPGLPPTSEMITAIEKEA